MVIEPVEEAIMSDVTTHIRKQGSNWEIIVTVHFNGASSDNKVIYVDSILFIDKSKRVVNSTQLRTSRAAGTNMLVSMTLLVSEASYLLFYI